MRLFSVPAFLLSLACLLPCVSFAQEAKKPETAVMDAPYDKTYSNIEQILSRLVKTEKAGARDNHFCVVLYSDEGNKHAWVHWAEDNALIQEEPGLEDLTLVQRRINLDKDVVATEDEIGTSTYLVTKDFVQRILDDCNAHGQKITIARSK